MHGGGAGGGEANRPKAGGSLKLMVVENLNGGGRQGVVAGWEDGGDAGEFVARDLAGLAELLRLRVGAALRAGREHQLVHLSVVVGWAGARAGLVQVEHAIRGASSGAGRIRVRRAMQVRLGVAGGEPGEGSERGCPGAGQVGSDERAGLDRGR